jgi:amino acid adenylation domain-containing protein
VDWTTAPALHARFLRGLALSGAAPAVRVGTETVSYEQAHERALRWAGALVEHQPRAVGVLADKGVTAYVGILAALYAGAAVVPLRPDFPVDRTRQMLAVSGATALIVDQHGAAVQPELLCGRSGIAVLATGPAAPVPAAPALAEPHAVGPQDIAYILFTSGSTGRPKGVPITHGSAEHYFRLQDARYDFTPEDVFSQAFDLNFDCAMFDLFCAWGSGAEAVAVPGPAYRRLPEFLTGNRVTVWFSTPSVIGLVRRTSGLPAGALPSLRWSLFAGEALLAADAADWRRAAPGSVLENLYGPTELTITVAAHRWSDGKSPGMAVHGVVPIGVCHDGHQQMLLGEDGEPAEDEGELCIAGPQLTSGYLDPDDDRGRFLTRSGRRWYRTGDRVRWIEHGELAYLGRRDAQLQVQGWRVEPAEIEHALRACPGVSDAAVVGVATGAGTELFAFYTGTATPAVELARRLRAALPDVLVPQRYHRLAELPLNANRKTDRGRLAEQARQLLAGAGNRGR